MEYRIKVLTETEGSRKDVFSLISLDRRVTANKVYKELDTTSRNTLRTRFEYWQSGKTHKKYFHGWDQSEFKGRYTRCFVFKLGDNRFYGFLRSRIKKDNPGYEICVLVLHAKKTERETYEPDLRVVEELRTTLSVQRAVDDFFKKEQS